MENNNYRNGNGGREPAFSMNMGSIRAAGWINERQGRNGGTYASVSVRIERRYRDGNGNWSSTNSFDLNELLRLQHFLGKVIDRANEEERGEAA